MFGSDRKALGGPAAGLRDAQVQQASHRLSCKLKGFTAMGLGVTACGPGGDAPRSHALRCLVVSWIITRS